MVHMREAGPVRDGSGVDRWRRSAAFREIARRSARANLAAFRRAPRCGAKRKRDGQPCCKPAMKNGRCSIHGGLTPRGDQWHRPRLPAAPAKLNRKLRDLDRRQKKRVARVAVMTPDERAAHHAWQQSHKPGTPGPRRAAREARRQNRAARDQLNAAPVPPQHDPLIENLGAAIDELRRKAECLTRSTERTGALNVFD